MRHNSRRSRLKAGHRAELGVQAGHNTLVFVLSGQVELADGEPLHDARLAVFERQGGLLTLTATKDSKLLLLSGEPIDEPVVAHDPFVMNTEAEIRQAFEEFQTGRMGQLVS